MTEATQQQVQAPFVLMKTIGTGDKAGEMQKVGDVVKIEAAKFEAYEIPGTDLIVDKAKSGEYYLKQKNPAFDEQQPADFKTNSRYNIVSCLYKTLNKAGTSVYFRGTIGPKDKPEERVTYRMFKNTPKAS